MVLDYCNIIRFCSNVNPEGGGRPVIYENYCGGKIDWNDFFRVKNIYREKLKNGEEPQECKNCVGYEDKEWDGGNYINEILFTPWFACNSKCIYCDASKDPEIARNTIPYNIIPLVKDMIANNILKKDAIIDFAGGEPTIYENFEELLNLFINENFSKIIIHTNAINHSPAIEEGIRNGLINILVSVDAGTKDVHKIVKGVESFDAVWGNLKRYSAVQKEPFKQVKTKYLLVPGYNDNKEQIDLWLEKSHDIGIKNVVFNLDHRWLVNNNCVNSNVMDVYNLMNYALSAAKRRGMYCELYGQIFKVKTMIENKVEHNQAGFF